MIDSFNREHFQFLDSGTAWDSTVSFEYFVGSTEDTGGDPVFRAFGHCSFNRVRCFRRCHIRTKVSAGDVQVQHLGITDPGDILNQNRSNI